MSALLLLTALLATAPRPLDPVPANLPAASRYTLGNGLRVVLVPNHAAPWLEVRLAFRVGSASDPKGQGGLASMVGSMLTSGVPGQDEQAFAEALARLGGRIAVDVDARTTTIAGQVTTLDGQAVPRFLALFRAAALEATLPESVLERQKKLRLAGIDNLKNDPETLADVAIRAAVLDGHAEGRPTFGTLASTKNLTRAALVRWRDRAFVPEHAVLVIGGAFDEAAMLAWVNDKFGPWKSDTTCDPGLGGHCVELCLDGDCLTNPTAQLRVMATGSPQPPILLIATDDPTATQIPWRYGQVNPVALTNPGWGALRLATQVLGGEFTSRLSALLRIEHGLTYAAYLSPDFGGHESGVMTIETDAPPDALQRSIALGLAEYRRMAAEDVGPDELEAMRGTLVNGFPFRFETVSDVVMQFLFVELADMPYTWLGTYTDVIASVDARAVRDAFAAALALRQHLVVVGPATLAPTLERMKLGLVRVVPVDDFLTNGL